MQHLRYNSRPRVNVHGCEYSSNVTAAEMTKFSSGMSDGRATLPFTICDAFHVDVDKNDESRTKFDTLWQPYDNSHWRSNVNNSLYIRSHVTYKTNFLWTRYQHSHMTCNLKSSKHYSNLTNNVNSWLQKVLTVDRLSACLTGVGHQRSRRHPLNLVSHPIIRVRRCRMVVEIRFSQFGSQKPQKLQFLGVNRRFQAKRMQY